MIEKNTIILNQLANGRSELVGFSRLLSNDKITHDKLIESAVEHCSKQVEDRNVLVINDTTGFDFGDHHNYLDEEDDQLGPMCNEGEMGFYLHPGLVLDAEDEIGLGFSYIKIWNRKPDQGNKKDRKYIELPLKEKESYRWIECGIESKKNLSKAKHITIIADRESDIYQEFVMLPDDKTDLIIRSCQDRSLADSDIKLYETLSKSPCFGTYKLKVRANLRSKREARDAVMEVRWEKVKIKKPSTVKDKSLPAYAEVYALEAKEKSHQSSTGKPICWRLLTTHPINQFEDALKIIQWYGRRWQIELLFGTLKSKGLNFEASEVESGSGLKNLCIISLQVALKINQLSQGRESEKEKSAAMCFDSEQIVVLKALLDMYEGKTEKQKNNYKEGTLAWAAWIIARMGGWKGYASESKPGNKTMRIGIMQLEKISIGWKLAQKMCA